MLKIKIKDNENIKYETQFSFDKKEKDSSVDAENNSLNINSDNTQKIYKLDLPNIISKPSNNSINLFAKNEIIDKPNFLNNNLSNNNMEIIQNKNPNDLPSFELLPLKNQSISEFFN